MTRLDPHAVLACRCWSIISRAAESGGADLYGYSPLDLCADNIPGATLDELKRAIVRGRPAGCLYLSHRVLDLIDGYATTTKQGA